MAGATCGRIGSTLSPHRHDSAESKRQILVHTIQAISAISCTKRTPHTFEEALCRWQREGLSHPGRASLSGGSSPRRRSSRSSSSSGGLRRARRHSEPRVGGGDASDRAEEEGCSCTALCSDARRAGCCCCCDGSVGRSAVLTKSARPRAEGPRLPGAAAGVTAGAAMCCLL